MMHAIVWLAALAQGECDGKYGTKVTWEKSPAAAAERAAKEGRLVAVLDTSGNFEDPDKT